MESFKKQGQSNQQSGVIEDTPLIPGMTNENTMTDDTLFTPVQNDTEDDPLGDLK